MNFKHLTERDIFCLATFLHTLKYSGAVGWEKDEKYIMAPDDNKALFERQCWLCKTCPFRDGCNRIDSYGRIIARRRYFHIALKHLEDETGIWFGFGPDFKLTDEPMELAYMYDGLNCPNCPKPSELVWKRCEK